MPPALARPCDAEDRVKEDVVDFLGSKGIVYVDVTQALSGAARRHIPIYPKDSDNHPLAAGYAAIAGAVFDALKR